MSKRKKLGLFGKIFGTHYIGVGFNSTKYMVNNAINELDDTDLSISTFEEACIKNDLYGNVEEMNNILLKKFNAIKYSYYFKFFVFWVVLIYGISSSGGGFIEKLNSLIYFSVALVFLTLTIKDGYNCLQINNRRFLTIKDYIFNPKVWVPYKFKVSETFKVDKEEEENL